MIFFITTLDRQSDFRHFHFAPSELETGFDALNKIVAQGEVLFKATVIDGKSVTHLPVESFDGYCCQSFIKALEHEWCDLLTSPLNRNNNRDLN